MYSRQAPPIEPLGGSMATKKPTRHTEMTADFLAQQSRLMPSGCIEWTGGCVPDVYGYVTVGQKSFATHREAWKLANGPIPAGMFVCHSCDVPACINPDHLFLGTPKDNYDDMVRKGRGRWARGAAHGQSKLTPDQVQEIVARVNGGTFHGKAGAPYGVKNRCVQSIMSGRTWGWLTGIKVGGV